jgi:hypothetical protein
MERREEVSKNKQKPSGFWSFYFAGGMIAGKLILEYPEAINDAVTVQSIVRLLMFIVFIFCWVDVSKMLATHYGSNNRKWKGEKK